MGMLSDEERASLSPARLTDNATPVPTRVMSSDVKRAIFGENSARMYRYDVRKAAWRDDRFAALKTDYERRGREPSNMRYGFVVPT